MRHNPLAALFALTAFIAFTPFTSRAAEPGWELARPAEEFVDSIGVCTHWNYEKLAYAKSFEQVKQRLAESGIRHVRDMWHPRLAVLWRELGVQVMVFTEPNQGPLEKQMAVWKENLAGISDIEGPNEPNNFWPKQNQRYQGVGYPDGVRRWQDDLFKAVQNDPELAGLRVVSPSPIFNGAYEMAPINSFDLLNMHPYAGGGMPSESMAWNNRTRRTTQALMGSDGELKPVLVSESGYHYALEGSETLGGPQGGITETAGGKYFPRHFAEFFNAGVVRTYTYELLDQRPDPKDPEANFGLIRFDLSPKPSFVAISNLIALLHEGRFDADKQQWIRPEVAERAVRIAVDGPETVHHSTLIRSDGTLDLLIWNEVKSFDQTTHQDLAVEPVAVTVSLANAAAGELYDPLTNRTPVRLFESATTFELLVPDQVLLLRLKSATQAKLAGDVPAPPQGLAVTATTATSANLQWTAGDSATAAFIVKRPGRLPLTIPPTSGGTVAYTDAELTPGLTFAYSVHALSAEGRLSEAATVKALTGNNRPDLIVKRIAMIPPEPAAGDRVRFSAVIANVGDDTTPAVTLGVAFSVNGKVVCWSDSHQDPLPAGAEITLISNSGPDGSGEWQCPDGTFRIDANVDDVNRIEEINERNNSAKSKYSTGVGADLIVTEVRAADPAVVGKPASLIGVVKNIGNSATPEKVTVSCTFLLDNGDGKPASLGYGTVHEPIQPGASVEIKMEKPWTPAQSGIAKVIGVVDDVDRIAELDEANNRTAPMDIPVK